MGLLQPAASYNCPNESSQIQPKDLDNFRSQSYLEVQYTQLLLNVLSVLGFMGLFTWRGFFPKNVNVNAKVLLTFFLVTSFGHSLTALTFKLHYVLMSSMAICVLFWVMPFYDNAHLVYVVLSNSPFWFLLALILERLAAVIGWRSYESAGPVLSIFLTFRAVHTVFPYFGNGVMGMSIDLTVAYGVKNADVITNFFITAMLFHGTLAVVLLYRISRKKLVQCKTKLMSPYQLVENVQITYLLLKIFALYLMFNVFGDWYQDYVDLPQFSSFMRSNNFDFMALHRAVLPLQLMILFGTLETTSDRHNFA